MGAGVPPTPPPGKGCSCAEGGALELGAGQRSRASFRPTFPTVIQNHSFNKRFPGAGQGRLCRLWAKTGIKAMSAFDPWEAGFIPGFQ